MGIKVSRQIVFDNLNRFKETLEEGKPFDLSHHLRNYAAFLNKHTGALRFILSWDRELYLRDKSDWIQIDLVAEDQEETIRFHVKRPKDLQPLVEEILSEMLSILNELASLYAIGKESSSEKDLLEHLSEIEFEQGEESIEKMPGWVGKLRRLQAEKKLIDHPPGSYLIRYVDDGVAEELSAINQMKVKTYVVTFVEPEGKISDILLLNTERGWTICRDESDLRSSLYKFHPTLLGLLSSIKDKVVTPI